MGSCDMRGRGMCRMRDATSAPRGMCHAVPRGAMQDVDGYAHAGVPCALRAATTTCLPTTDVMSRL